MADVAQGFDHVVVGGGTAGCALAARLSEDSSRTVCLIEAGGSGKSVYVNVPGAIVMAQRNAALNWRFQTVPQPQLNGRRISLPRGRGLGGSALINGMVYFRGNPRDFDAWAAGGAAGWSYREVLPYFRRSEHNENFGGSVYHGSDGPMNVRVVTRPNPLNFSFFDALASLGYTYREDLNGADSEGMGLRQLSIRGGTRETTASALLRPALGRRNLTVLTDTQATRVVLEGKRAVAVEARGPGGNVVVKAHQGHRAHCGRIPVTTAADALRHRRWRAPRLGRDHRAAPPAGRGAQSARSPGKSGAHAHEQRRLVRRVMARHAAQSPERRGIPAAAQRPAGQQHLRIRRLREIGGGTRQAGHSASLPAGQAAEPEVSVSDWPRLRDQSGWACIRAVAVASPWPVPTRSRRRWSIRTCCPRRRICSH